MVRPLRPIPGAMPAARTRARRSAGSGLTPFGFHFWPWLQEVRLEQACSYAFGRRGRSAVSAGSGRRPDGAQDRRHHRPEDQRYRRSHDRFGRRHHVQVEHGAASHHRLEQHRQQWRRPDRRGPGHADRGRDQRQRPHRLVRQQRSDRAGRLRLGPRRPSISPAPASSTATSRSTPVRRSASSAICRPACSATARASSTATGISAAR